MLKRIIKTVLWIGAATLSLNVHAVNPGFYIGLQIGAGMNNAKVVPATAATPSPFFAFLIPATPRKTQYGGRFLLGYKWNRWIAWELGATFFSLIKYSTSPFASCGRNYVFVGVLDTLLKPTITLGPFDMYVLGGISANYIVNSPSLQAQTVKVIPNVNFPGTFRQNNKFCEERGTAWAFGGLYGLGTNFELSQNWVADVEYKRYYIGNQFVKSINFISIGIAYHLVDRYCGQFLCDD